MNYELKKLPLQARKRIDMKQKLQYLILNYGPTQVKFAQRIGTAQSTVANWLRTGKIPDKGIYKIVQAIPDLQYEWFCQEFKRPMPKRQTSLATSPFYEDIDSALAPGKRPSGQLAIPGSSATLYVRNHTSAMVPSIVPSDIIGLHLVQDHSCIIPGHSYILHTTADEKLLRRIQSCDQGILTLVSGNPDEYPTFTLPLTSVRALYRVVSIIHTTN